MTPKGWAEQAPQSVSGGSPTLPFVIKVTEEPFENRPAYMGGANPDYMDFPFCPVMIDGEYWVIYKNGYQGPVYRYKGTNIENAVRQPDGSTSAFPPGTYILGGVWYDASDKKLYAPLHTEVHNVVLPILREIHLASSTDKGLTWKYEGPIITNSLQTPRKLQRDFKGKLYSGGDGDQLIYVDQRGGYVYIFTDDYVWGGGQFLRHCVARCAMTDKMPPGKWWKFHDGKWDQPGLGGKASYVNGYSVTYNNYLKKYLSFNYLTGLSFCSDLGKQDWSPSFHLGDFWGADNSTWAFWPVDSDKQNTSSSGENLYVYTFFQRIPGRRFHVKLSQGTTGPDQGFTSPSVWFQTENTPHRVITANPGPTYDLEPFAGSSDPVEARQTRQISCQEPEVKYSGNWSAMSQICREWRPRPPRKKVPPRSSPSRVRKSIGEQLQAPTQGKPMSTWTERFKTPWTAGHPRRSSISSPS